MWNYCNANTVQVIHIIIYNIVSLYLEDTTVHTHKVDAWLASYHPLFHKMPLNWHIADLLQY